MEEDAGATTVVTVLGRVSVGGSPVTRRQQAILAGLVLHREAGATADRLVDLVWPESVPKSARASLQNQIARLRSGFGPKLIETTGQGYRLGVSSDVQLFETLVHRARATADRGTAVALLEEARGLWGGSPFNCLTENVGADVERARLEAVRADALDHLALCRMALGDLDAALGELGVLVYEDPYREQRWEMMMRALHLAGRRVEALAAFNRLEETLRRELGVRPSEQLGRLAAQIRASNAPGEEPLAVGAADAA